MGILYSVLGFLIAISVLVAVHEFGHFWAARRLGVKVLKFSIGFGTPLWSRVSGPDQTEYRVAAIPLGGYVQMLGEGDPDSPVDPKDAHRTFDSQPIWKRSVIAAAGPAINFLFAVVLFMFLGFMPEQQFRPTFGELPAQSKLAKLGVQAGDQLLFVDGQAVTHLAEYNLYVFNQVLKGEPLAFTVSPGGADSGCEPESLNAILSASFGCQQKVLTVTTEDIPLYDINPANLVYQIGLLPYYPPLSTTLGRVLDSSPAYDAGLMVGDKVISVNGINVNEWRDLTGLIAPNAGQQIELQYERDGLVSTVALTPRLTGEGDTARGVIGIAAIPPVLNPDDLVTVTKSIPGAIQHGFTQTWLITSLTVRMLGKMITLQVSPKNVNGPITIADVAGQTIQIDWLAYIQFLAVISISLGIMNLLPIPMLDGGHLMMFAVEGVAGKRASERFYAVGQRVGIFLLAGLMSLAFYNDIFRLLN